jgi:hypothetical protein
MSGNESELVLVYVCMESCDRVRVLYRYSDGILERYLLGPTGEGGERH